MDCYDILIEDFALRRIYACKAAVFETKLQGEIN